jgi:putative acetyltransferase
MEYSITGVEASEFSVLTEIWEEAIRATHHFLEEEDFTPLKQKTCIDLLPELEIRAARDADGGILGFCGVHDENLEMLFLRKEARGRGLGRRLMELAIDELGVRSLDVYEENTRAADLYRRRGFVAVDRSPLDDVIDKPHPLLHMELREQG